MSAQEPPFTDEQVRGMVEHMNDDHADSVLAYAQHFGGLREATSARLVDVGPEVMRIAVTLPSGEREIDITYDHRLESSHDAHMTMVKMSKAAKRALAGN
ncbi:MAG: DUF2470 domain-containing protein [Opitutales bacterium]